MNLEVVRVQLCNNISLHQGPPLSYVLCFEKYSCHENHDILVYVCLCLQSSREWKPQLGNRDNE